MPDPTAQFGQQVAVCNAALDGMVATVRAMLADGADPNATAVRTGQLFFHHEPARACTALGFALVRLARQPSDRPEASRG